MEGMYYRYQNGGNVLSLPTIDKSEYHEFDKKACIRKKCTRSLYIVIIYKQIKETRKSSQHFLKSAGINY